MAQKIYSKMHPISCTNTPHDVTDLVNHQPKCDIGLKWVKNANTRIWQKRNTTSLWNKKNSQIAHFEKFYRGGNLLSINQYCEIIVPQVWNMATFYNFCRHSVTFVY